GERRSTARREGILGRKLRLFHESQTADRPGSSVDADAYFLGSEVGNRRAIRAEGIEINHQRPFGRLLCGGAGRAGLPEGREEADRERRCPGANADSCNRGKESPTRRAIGGLA